MERKYPKIPVELLRNLVFKLANCDNRYGLNLPNEYRNGVYGLGTSLFKPARLNQSRYNTLQYLKSLFHTNLDIVDAIDRILALGDDHRRETN